MPQDSPAFHDLVVAITVTLFEDYFAAIQTPGGQAAVEHADTYLSNVKFMLLEPQQIWR